MTTADQIIERGAEDALFAMEGRAGLELIELGLRVASDIAFEALHAGDDDLYGLVDHWDLALCEARRVKRRLGAAYIRG